jgi:hypothetical protein
MIGKKINQLATELAPVSTDLTIIGDPDSGVSKKITLAQLGAIFSGAVSFYTNLASFPVTGDINVIYCAKDTQKLYLWSGSAYVEVFPSQALLDTYQLRSEKGVSNGYASLDSAGKVPISQLPSSIMEYKGTWNASTNTPTLANGTGDTGDVYICNVAGTVNFGAGAITFAVGDYVIYSGTIWQRSSGAVGTVTSVAASITGDAIGITGSPITTSGTLALAFAGTSAQYINGAGNLTTFPTSLISGSGASGQVTFFNGANSVTGTNNFFWDATNNRLGIGTTTPQRSIEIYNTTADNHLRLSGNAPSVSMGEAVTGSVYQAKFGLVTTNGQFVSAGVAGDFVIISQTGATIIGTSSTEKMRVNTSGNVSINNTNNTYKLDVTGTGRYTGQLRLESTITDGTNTYTLPSATGTLALTSQIPSVTGYVPYTGATANVDLGTHTLIAAKGTFSSSGSSDTVSITHSSGSGIALNITKGGNGEGLYINKTSGSGNAATIIGTLNATTLVKSGGTSSQFLKADGSVDSTSYGTGSVTSVGLSSATSGVTIGSTPITTSGTITLAIATASGSQQGLLSSTDWTTFNNKQNALTNPVTGTGTTNYLPKFTGASTIGDSIVEQTASGINVAFANSGASNVFEFQNTSNTSSSNARLKIATGGTSAGNAILQFTDNTNNWYINPDSAASYSLKIGTSISDNKLVLTTSGNLGLGVTPSAWGYGGNFNLEGAGRYISSKSDDTRYASNVYNDGTNEVYSSTGFATRYRQANGIHSWVTAPSGTAGNAISFTQAMTLDASGRLGIGTTTMNQFVNIRSASTTQSLINIATSDFSRILNVGVISSAGYVMMENAASLVLGTSGVAALTIASTGAATFFGKTNISKAISDYAFTITNTDSNGYGMYLQAGSTNNAIDVFNAAGSTQLFKLTGTGAATFSSSVQASSVTATTSINGASVNTLGTQSTFRITSNYAGSGDIPAGTLMYLDDNTYTNLGLIPSSSGTAGSKIAAVAFNGSAWRSMWEFANVSSGNPNLLLVKSGGNVGIGTTSPSGKLNVFGAKPSITSVEVGVVTIDDSTSYAAGVGGSLLLRGNYRGLGDQVGAAGIEASKVNSTDGDYGFNMLFYTRQNGSSLAEKMRITSGGEVVIGGTNTTGSGLTVYSSGVGNTGIEIRTTATSGNNVVQYNRMAVAGTTSNYLFAGQDSTQDKIYIYGNGNVVNRNNSYGAISDIKLKENISDTTSKLADLLKVKVRNYNLIGDDKKQIGVIAQELETIFPSMVEVDGKTGMKQVKYSVFVPMLIKAIQELNDKIK